MMNSIIAIFSETLHLLVESGVYVIFGLMVSGLIRVFLSPDSVARHLGKGRFRSVFKAALLGIPLPLCSCGVLPAAVTLKKQGANNGAISSFLISTPESGVDSIAVTYALLDPIMTLARPLSAFATALTAGIAENLLNKTTEADSRTADLTCPVDGCCDGIGCSAEDHKRHHSFFEKIRHGMHYAFTEVWNDMAPWFAAGLILAGAISAFIPEAILSRYLGGGLLSMLIMLTVGIPIYICATASTPIAAALILKGVSPGAALVFLLAGPATNAASLTVLLGILGKRSTAVYLALISIMAVISGLIVDQIYAVLALSPIASLGRTAEIIPEWVKWTGAAIVLLLSVKPIYNSLRCRFMSILNKIGKPSGKMPAGECAPEKPGCGLSNCGCSSGISREWK